MRFVVLRRLALIGAGVTALVGSVPSAQAAPVTTVNVAAADYITSTGVTITSGTAAAIIAFGRADVCDGGCPSGPRGSFNGALGVNPGVEGQRAGLLVGTLDGGTTFFPVGAGPTVITGVGPLSLGLNDGTDYGDNTGSYTALIALFPTAEAVCAHGGYRNLTTALGTSFTNEAACVSYTRDGR
jgi:hypothetical protein